MFKKMITSEILGLTKNGKYDQHFVYKNETGITDSLSPTREAAKYYSERSYRLLSIESMY